jgi:hypothetical protein
MTYTAKHWSRAVHIIDAVALILFVGYLFFVRNRSGNVALAIDRSGPLGVFVYVAVRCWATQERKKAEEALSLGSRQEPALVGRRPFSHKFHPNWIFAITAMSVCVGALDLGWSRDDPLRDYSHAMPWVFACQLVQLIRDYRASEWWYRLMTSPPYRWTPRQYLSKKWPSMLAFLAVPFFGFVTVGALYFSFTILFFPWQRSLYLRSIREFGPNAQPQTANQLAL